MVDRFIGTVDRNAAGTRPPADFPSRLIPQFVEIADSGQNGWHVARFILHNPGDSIQQVSPVLGEAVAVRSGQADAGNDDSVVQCHEIAFGARRNEG